MSQKYNLSIWDIAFIELADFFAAFFIVGVLATIYANNVTIFFSKWKWIFLTLSIIFTIIALQKMMNKKKKDLLKEKDNKKIRKKR